MSSCPNINDPSWKDLVSRVGLSQAYDTYIQSGYTIPNYTDFKTSMMAIGVWITLLFQMRWTSLQP